MLASGVDVAGSKPLAAERAKKFVLHRGGVHMHSLPSYKRTKRSRPSSHSGIHELRPGPLHVRDATQANNGIVAAVHDKLSSRC